ncbi:alpha/beta hydrolase [Streptomyces hygroscopicus]|uniref:3-oxoadipate enol-lactonase n=2 Tax=Streptomyces TaxID=1883 RepID=A0ABT9L178_9ACTN|nr:MULTISPECIES: alpha/beta hydrolase [Streptomyces]MCO8307187.1 alpha/beta hydrolase [Streptomyces sp. RKCA744]MDP9614462.1 3-oxoadipate enol-lactonase [Streptomyces demainii]GHJ32341.1 alpha/beta hydrolase [Streptomyces hygroscopicus]
MPELQIDGNIIHYEEHGEAGSPPLVLVHGLYGESAGLAPLAQRFARRFRVIAPDALGHGLSSHPAEFGIEDQGRVLAGLIAALGYPKAAILGISMGSYLAAQAAILEPARVSALVLVVPKAHGRTSSTAAYAARKGFDLTTATPEETTAFLAEVLWSPHTSQARREEILAAQLAAQRVVLTPEERATIDRSLRGFDLRPGLATIAAPTLVVSGRADGLNPPEAGQEVARGIPGARFEVYEHSGHQLASEETDRLVEDVEAFLQGRGPSARLPEAGAARERGHG